MKRIPALLLAAVLFTAAAALVYAWKFPARHPRLLGSTPSNICPLRTPEEWQEFLEGAADDEGWARTCEDSPCDEEYYEFVGRNIYGTFERCAEFLRAHPAIAECTR